MPPAVPHPSTHQQAQPAPYNIIRTSSLTIATWNTQGFISPDRLQLILHSLALAGVDILLLQETNLRVGGPHRTLHTIQLPSDYVLSTPSTNATTTNRGKGVAILVSPKLAGSGLTTNGPVLRPVYESVNDSFELLAAQIGSTVLISVYIHANHHPDYELLSHELISIPGFTDPSRNFIIGGDWNHPDDRHHLETEVLSPLNLRPVHDPAHPLPSRGDNPLDLLYFKGPDLTPSNYRTVQGAVSDHLMVMAAFSAPTVTFDHNDNHTIICWDRLRSLQGDAARQLVEDVMERADAAASSAHPLSALNESLLELAAEHLETKPIHPQTRVSWWTPQLGRIQHRLFRAARQRKAKHARTRRRAHRRYKDLRKQFRAACQRARRQAAHALRTKVGQGDVDIAWVASHHHRGKKHPRFLRRTGPDPSEAQECWAGVFSDDHNPRPDKPMPDPTVPDLWDADDVLRAIHKTKDRTPGPDGLRATFLRFLVSEIDEDANHILPVARALANCFHAAVRATIDPSSKVSTTVLIPKPGTPPTSPNDYRPIALQPILTKVLETLVADKIWAQVDNNEVPLSDDQGGFRAHRSRHDLIFLLRCAQDHYHPRGRFRRGRAPSRPLYAAFLDFRKAYDSVPHQKLILQLQRLGVNPHLVRVVADLLSDRTTTVLGRPVPIHRGVPQGGPLSPLLFILFMQSLSAAIEPLQVGGAFLPGAVFVRVLLYADDLNLIAESPEALTALIRACEEWAASEDIQLTFNHSKSKLLVLAGPPVPIDQLPPISLDGHDLEWAPSFKYLGSVIYAHHRGPAREPFNVVALHRSIAPLFPFLSTKSTHRFYLKSRVLILRTMTENVTLHNAPVSDYSYRKIDKQVNRWLTLAAGCPSRSTRATFLRCDLGVLPSQLVVERDALYFLWHLCHHSWFRAFLPFFTDLPLLQRLTSLVIQHGLDLNFLQRCSKEEWHSEVQSAIVRSATRHFNRRPVTWLPHHRFVRSHRYLKHPDLAHLADITLHLRNDRLPSAPQAWVHHPCPFCTAPASLNGSHLLSCPQLTPELDAQRVLLMQRADAALTPAEFAQRVLECDPKQTSSLWLQSALRLGQQICRLASHLTDPQAPSSAASVSSQAVASTYDAAACGGSSCDDESVVSVL